MGSSLRAQLQSHVAEHPNGTAFTFLDSELHGRQFTFRELFDTSEALAAELRLKHLDRTAPVGILLQSQEAQVLHYVAVLSAGLTPSILTPPNRKLNLGYYLATTRATLDRCGFSAVVSDLEALEASVTTLAPWTLRERSRAAQAKHAPVNDAAFLQFSSGTTGFKRGVLVSDDAVVAQLSAYAHAIELKETDRILSWLPLYHDMGLIACLQMPLVFGIPCAMIHPLDWVSNPGLYLQAISEFRSTLSWNPNFAYAFMADRVRDQDLQGVDLSSLRGLVNCSEPVTYESQERFQSRFAPYGLPPEIFWGCYAMAETTFALTHGCSADPGYLDHDGPPAVRPDGVRRPYVSVGRPIDGVELRIVDEAGSDVPGTSLGELWARSPFNFTGYYNNAESTVAACDGDWYKTGDIGYQRDGTYFVCARKKDLIIVGGVNIYPQDVEDLASAVEGAIRGRVACFAEFDTEKQTERIVVLVETNRPPDVHLNFIIEIRQRMLSAFQIANFDVYLVEPMWLVKSSAGKMARNANREKWARCQRTQ